MSDELATTLASIQEFMAGMTGVLPLGTSHSVPFHLLDHCETILPHAATVSLPITTTTNDTRLVEKEERGKTKYQGEDQRSTVSFFDFPVND
ncbi:hypothetical protein CK203_102627 [Vitis vinifera]|uniref:Uncharacterized protein n=1 Tax=Vitis vinifera TaxID=29760 RepID=A0A438CX64_VITVI|nr:hypothetical protein CK203_102627 [Vitis vinifera]